MVTAFLFPGQGAQYPRMGNDLWQAFREVRDLFEVASEIVGADMTKLLFEADKEELNRTDNAQMAIALVDLAVRLALKAKGVVSDFCAGFSLGEYPALVDAGVLLPETMFAAVAKRGKCTQEATVEVESRWGETGMAVVLGLKWDTLETILSETGVEHVYLANHNAPVQITLAGTRSGLEKLRPYLMEAGAKRVIPISVTGPFHSPLLRGAAKSFAKWLEGIPFQNPSKPIYSNVTGERIRSGEEAKRLCEKQITSPVRWVSIEEKMARSGVEKVREVGPGKVLSGLWAKRRSDEGPSLCYPMGTIEAIDQLDQGGM